MSQDAQQHVPPSLTRRVLQGAAWTSGTTVVNALVGIVSVVVVARVLEPAEFGRYALLQLIFTTAMALSELGVSDLVMRRGARANGVQDQDGVRRAARAYTTWYAVRAPLPTGLALWLLEPRAAGLYIVAVLVNAASMGAAAWLGMRSEYKAASLTRSVAILVGASTAAVVALQTRDAGDTLAASTLASAASNLLLLMGVPARNRLSLLTPGSLTFSSSEYRVGFGNFATTQVQEYVFGRTELFFFPRSQAAAQGLYAAAQTLAARATIVLDALYAALPIALVESAARDREAMAAAYQRVLRLTSLLLLVVAAPISLAVVAVPPVLFGQEYRGAVPLVAVLTSISLLQTAGMPYAGVRYALGRTGAPAVIGGVCVAIDIALSVALIPSRGATGAAIAATVAAGIFLTADALFVARLVPGAGVVRQYLFNVTVVLSALGAAAALIVLPLNPLNLLALGAAVLALQLVLLRSLGVRGVRGLLNEVRVLLSALRRRST